MSRIDEDGTEIIRADNVSFSEGQDRVHREMLEQHTRRMMVATLMLGMPLNTIDIAIGEKLVTKAVAMADLIIKATE